MGADKEYRKCSGTCMGSDNGVYHIINDIFHIVALFDFISDVKSLVLTVAVNYENILIGYICTPFAYGIYQMLKCCLSASCLACNVELTVLRYMKQGFNSQKRSENSACTRKPAASFKE